VIITLRGRDATDRDTCRERHDDPSENSGTLSRTEIGLVRTV